MLFATYQLTLTPLFWSMYFLDHNNNGLVLTTNVAGIDGGRSLIRNTLVFTCIFPHLRKIFNLVTLLKFTSQIHV